MKPIRFLNQMIYFVQSRLAVMAGYPMHGTELIDLNTKILWGNAVLFSKKEAIFTQIGQLQDLTTQYPYLADHEMRSKYRESKYSHVASTHSSDGKL